MKGLILRIILQNNEKPWYRFFDIFIPSSIVSQVPTELINTSVFACTHAHKNIWLAAPHGSAQLATKPSSGKRSSTTTTAQCVAYCPSPATTSSLNAALSSRSRTKWTSCRPSQINNVWMGLVTPRLPPDLKSFVLLTRL